MEIALFVGFFCLAPLVLLTLGFWLGRGAPGFPLKVVKRDHEEYAEEEDHPFYAQQRFSNR